MNKVGKVFIVTVNLNTASNSREEEMTDLVKDILEDFQLNEFNVDLLNLDEDVSDSFFQATTPKDSTIIEYQIRFQRADLIIFIYPISLGQVPSKIKYFLESVLTRGFSYKVVQGQIKGVFNEKIIWSIGFTDLPNWKVNTIWGNSHLNWWNRVVKEYSGSKVKTWLIANWRSLSSKDIQNWRAKFNKTIGNINTKQNLLDLI